MGATGREIAKIHRVLLAITMGFPMGFPAVVEAGYRHMSCPFRRKRRATASEQAEDNTPPVAGLSLGLDMRNATRRAAVDRVRS
jgi:hypothetical protein